MDILRFVNSKDIRKHLSSIGYRFNSLEAAWLIRQCRDATIKEKHNAWEELIKTMPDCEIPERANTVYQESLHLFLRKYMELENKYIKQFYAGPIKETFDYENPYIYQFSYLYKDGSKYDDPNIFSLFCALQKTTQKSNKDIVSIRCTKTQIDAPDSRSFAKLNSEIDLLKIDPDRIEDKEESDIFFGVFKGLWFEFPTPFKKGDIVWDPLFNVDNNDPFVPGGPFVTTVICLEGIENERLKTHLRQDGNNSDMFAMGYFLTSNGDIFPERMSNYMNLEYYNEKLTGPARTLIPISNFLKGKIDVCLCATAYHQIMTESYSRMYSFNRYSKRGLILAGLEEDTAL
ncbi:MAG: hypothetical protein K6F76_04205 [Clostridiales bacterium]|nr:hypothetical protein [Clostridiales bacterium]